MIFPTLIFQLHPIVTSLILDQLACSIPKTNTTFHQLFKYAKKVATFSSILWENSRNIFGRRCLWSTVPILDCVIFSGYHRHIDNCTREMSKFLLDQIKKIKHSPMESIAADWKILDVPKLLELSRVFGKVRDVFC